MLILHPHQSTHHTKHVTPKRPPLHEHTSLCANQVEGRGLPSRGSTVHRPQGGARRPTHTLQERCASESCPTLLHRVSAQTSQYHLSNAARGSAASRLGLVQHLTMPIISWLGAGWALCPAAPSSSSSRVACVSHRGGFFCSAPMRARGGSEELRVFLIS